LHFFSNIVNSNVGSRVYYIKVITFILIIYLSSIKRGMNKWSNWQKKKKGAIFWCGVHWSKNLQ